MNNGISKTEFNKLTMFEVEYFCEGMIHKRESSINDSLYLNYESAKLIALAVWGSNAFPNEVPTVRLTPKTKEEMMQDIRRMYNNLKAIAIKEGGEDNG